METYVVLFFRYFFKCFAVFYGEDRLFQGWFSIRDDDI